MRKSVENDETNYRETDIDHGRVLPNKGMFVNKRMYTKTARSLMMIRFSVF
jgi:hypothetical protein